MLYQITFPLTDMLKLIPHSLTYTVLSTFLIPLLDIVNIQTYVEWMKEHLGKFFKSTFIVLMDTSLIIKSVTISLYGYVIVFPWEMPVSIFAHF